MRSSRARDSLAAAQSRALGARHDRASVDLLVVSLGTTPGLRASDRRLVRAMAESGRTVATVRVRVGALAALRRFYPATDLIEAVAARRALLAALRQWRPHAVVFSTTTAALCAPPLGCPYAIWFDSPARLNRPGRRNALQHALERRRFTAARLLLPASRAALAAVADAPAPAELLPLPLELPAAPPPEPREGARRRVRAVAYVPDPRAKGLDVLVRAWTLFAAARRSRPAPLLEIFGVTRDRAARWLERRRLQLPATVWVRGAVSEPVFRERLATADVFVHAARWEDFGRAPLEALAFGVPLATTPAGGPYPARDIVAAVAPDLLAAAVDPPALAAAIERAVAYSHADRTGLAEAARPHLEEFSWPRFVAIVRDRVVPELFA
ncbi:glycosyltransferase [Thermoleophilum album]|jgi:glycosyltransferase involved in cell wall biosynthesis|uniref:glycosyltransferase n=1 Tax=Thermoleophilum album TaxID=29539 RepID=UPI00237CEA50|nr:glycosyltransferase [Thermoleophilum album]WDT93512.1 glycosyltransferase [Thermoleophilum album]